MKTVLEIMIEEDGTLLYCKNRLEQLYKRKNYIKDRMVVIHHIMDRYSFLGNEEEKHIYDRAYKVKLKLNRDIKDCNMNIDVINAMVTEYIMTQI